MSSAEKALALDPALFAEFLAESLEALDGLDALFVQLEQNPDDLSVVDRIFRPVHSIKGNSSFFGLVNVKNFSHECESVLQEVRSRTRRATPALIGALLEGVDLLRAMLNRFAAGATDTALTGPEQQLLDRLRQLREEKGSEAALAEDVLRELTALASDALPDAVAAKVGRLQMSLRELLSRAGLVGAAGAEESERFRVAEVDVTEPVGTVRAFVADVSAAEKEEQRCEAFLAALAAIASAGRKASRNALAENVEALRGDFEAIHNSGIGFDDLLGDLLREKLQAVMSGLERAPATDAVQPSVATAPAAVSAAVSEQPAPAAGEKTNGNGSESASAKTIRVAEERVDDFMTYVGELIIAGEVFAYIQKKIEGLEGARQISQEFKNANLSFSELSTNLQKSLMAVRRIPVQTIAQKLPRIVRDSSNQLGKSIRLQMEGMDTQVDKSILEGIEAPLVHMVRNSVDHGLETPDERQKAGKPGEGAVSVVAVADDEFFRLIIRDDGRGIDTAAVRAKAVEKGAITPERAQSMTDKEAMRLIFGAGVSTAKQVTELSGRGVGMDVVMTNIARLNGTIDIDSVPGQGTTITIAVPMTVTLMVIDGLVARVGRYHYIVPMADVRESLRPSAKQLHTVSGKGEVVDVRGELHRLVRLHEVLGGDRNRADAVGCTAILVNVGARSCALLVDEVVGQQSVVLKDLGQHFEQLHLLRGAAILGDGRVGLVLDPEGILEFADS